jgi:glyoxylase-like metal-dependent hydrolase (beta-lactamase superfamily II)
MTVDIGVYCLDVGQGSCAAIIDPIPGGAATSFQACLIDVGVDGDALAEWLQSIGVQRIPLIALTHNDEDHIRGLPRLVHRYRPIRRRVPPRIGRLLFLIDRDPPDDIPYYLDAEQWVATGLVEETGRLETPRRYRPGMGGVWPENPRPVFGFTVPSRPSTRPRRRFVRLRRAAPAWATARTTPVR